MNEPRQQGQMSKVPEGEGRINSVSDPQMTGVRKGARSRTPSHKLRDFYT
jgi:hypothetical protein